MTRSFFTESGWKTNERTMGGNQKSGQLQGTGFTAWLLAGNSKNYQKQRT